MILSTTRAGLVADLPQAYREQNDLSSMNDAKIVAAWKRVGVHAGTWDWDDVNITEE